MLVYVGAVSLIILFLYIHIQKKLRYWVKKGVAHDEPIFFFGNTLHQAIGKEGPQKLYQRLYDNYSGKAVGFYSFTTPFLLVRDSQLIEKMIGKHENGFVDVATSDRVCFEGIVRERVLPEFADKKLGFLLEPTHFQSDVMVKRFIPQLNDDIDVTPVVQNYVIDVFSLLCGIKILNGPQKNDFIQNAQKLVDCRSRVILNEILNGFPRLCSFISLNTNSNKVEKYFRRLVKEKLEMREREEIKNDYTGILANLKRVEAESQSLIKSSYNLTGDLLAAQAFEVIASGFNPSILTLKFLLYELAVNPEIQEVVHDEVKTCIQANNGLNKAVYDMKFLEQCLQETLRLHPVQPYIQRYTTKPMTIGSCTIDSGVGIIVPLSALFKDPKLYPNPEKFNPHRFDSNETEITQFFCGGGPTNEIAFHFTLLIVKVAAARLVRNFDIKLSTKTKLPLRHKTSVYVSPTDLYYRFSPRTTLL